MTLLGDLGGLFEAFFIIAIGVHYLAVENTLPAKLLQHYFLIENEDQSGNQTGSNRIQ